MQQLSVFEFEQRKVFFLATLEMLLSGFLRNSVRITPNCGVLAITVSFRFIFTHKMADKPTNYSTTNGFESKTPFLIGVAGGTASGKVILH